MMLRMPDFTGSDKEKLDQIEAFLYKLVKDLNYILQNDKEKE